MVSQRDLRCKLALCCKTEYSNKTTEIKTSAVKICVALNKDIAIFMLYRIIATVSTEAKI